MGSGLVGGNEPVAVEGNSTHEMEFVYEQL